MKTSLKVASALIVTAFAVATVTLARYCAMIEDRFSEFKLDPKLVRKAYLNMLRNSRKGLYGDISDYDDEKMDAVFFAEYRALLKK